ncbi:aldehyde dehydrogenase [Aquibacillus rhizosphaerae]|uniref:Aldehyde dehydrogenase n=1 Tax=Aquibacillus rhizosphaerae TaxID=3051431 RepID=A0ABT7L2B9_9BACI|nr:aldehyde dehydrogenase [Aquibacillus sp. LR5S19]MDL4840003.1 aldehyde dehydrogenase [Aquibacillus sp. LR5S19]
MSEFTALIERQKANVLANKTKPVSDRIKLLKQLKSVLKKEEEKLITALFRDLNKSEFDAYTTEIGIVYTEIDFFIKHLRSWSKRKKVKAPLSHTGTRSYIYKEAYGSVLIISPWNYPIQLAIAPLIGAIAAGNSVILKPSELTDATSIALAKMFSENFEEEQIFVVQGGPEVSKTLLAEDFDYIFFTGSERVGKLVMEAAAKNLTPVTLELGGKSPCIVDDTADLKVAAKRIAWGKYTNAGQTCVAPDYIYIDKKIKKEFLEELKRTVFELYGEEPIDNDRYTKIVSEKHFDRLINFLSNGFTVLGGKTNREELVIEPTVLTDISWDDHVMAEEIFGPILPILEYEQLAEVIGEVNKRPSPLALYIFSESDEVSKQIISSISFGGGCINDVIYHLSSPFLPFGGVGSSGMGSYHGKASFDTFSHSKSIMKQTTKFDIALRYGTTKNSLKKIKLFLK